MDKALWNSDRTSATHEKRLDWRRKMSDHIAFALLVYTALQIYVTMGALETNGESILPYFALVLLVAAIIPGARMFEERWSVLSDDQAADPSFARAFKRDRLLLWIAAIALPFAISAVLRGVELFF